MRSTKRSLRRRQIHKSVNCIFRVQHKHGQNAGFARVSLYITSIFLYINKETSPLIFCDIILECLFFIYSFSKTYFFVHSTISSPARTVDFPSRSSKNLFLNSCSLSFSKSCVSIHDTRSLYVRTILPGAMSSYS